MEKRSNLKNSYLSSTLSPSWKSSVPGLKCTLTQNELSSSQPIKPQHKTQLEKYKLNYNKKFRQSPIVKASKNVEEFYRSIKPLKSKISSFKTPSKGSLVKSNLLISFNSGDSHEDLSMMSQVVNLERLERLKNVADEFIVKQENEM